MCKLFSYPGSHLVLITTLQSRQAWTVYLFCRRHNDRMGKSGLHSVGARSPDCSASISFHSPPGPKQEDLFWMFRDLRQRAFNTVTEISSEPKPVDAEAHLALVQEEDRPPGNRGQQRRPKTNLTYNLTSLERTFLYQPQPTLRICDFVFQRPPPNHE